jgi:hypothetical protein
MHNPKPITDSPTVSINNIKPNIIPLKLFISTPVPIKNKSNPRNIISEEIKKVSIFLLFIIRQLNKPEKYNIEDSDIKNNILMYKV